ncbi:nuclear transport factor 2 family protein [Allomuricauda sp. R78024]|uniref:nuclear transport factor 2 family protein n=1 Tax=Allomuricauda sp. R78024 TaxID=3093867 RepID=UPI0037C77F91
MNWSKKITAILFMGMTIVVNAQMAESSELYMTLKEKDSTLFDAAFNQCDVETMESLFTEDFEFYHDKGGITVGRNNFLAPNRENCAKIDRNEPQRAKRILVPGSLQVYPLYKQGKLYGAVQHGVHSFEFLNEQKEYQKGDVAKFIHVWILEDGHWKIKRELSYDHQLQ